MEELYSEPRLKMLVEGKLPTADQQLVFKALAYAKEAHHGQVRKSSGEPFIIHPINAAARLLEKFDDAELVAAALLHDVVEDCPQISVADLHKEFGPVVGFLVEAQTKGLDSFRQYPAVRIADKIERFLWAGIRDIRALLIKIAEREHNLATIEGLKPNKQIRMAFETQAIFQPLKQALSYGGELTIEQMQTQLNKLLVEQCLDSPLGLKEHLLAQAFANVGDELFGLVYKDSSSVVWRLTDKASYDRLCETPALKGRLYFITVAGNQNWFEAHFQFHSGAVLTGDMNLQLATFRGQ